MATTLTPTEAWEPLPASRWDASAAAHLLRRTGWSATPAEVARATADGLAPTLDRLFPGTPATIAKPDSVTRLREYAPEYVKQLAAANPVEKRQLQKEARERSQQALQDTGLRWLDFAAQPATAAQAKWVLFLSDVYVVSAEKVKNAALIWSHFDRIALHSLGPAPELTKAISRSPAMIEYLDLNQNRREAPNENFARELFELFLLGEGHYTERDIKESARAFTGYRQRFGEFFYAARQHDYGEKTIFGRTGHFTGDDVIALAYRQPAAGTFLPHELAKFYLTDEPLPAAQLEALGAWWSAHDYNLRALAQRFFASQLFFDQEYRANFIKSPVQLYLGLVQDLNLDVTPVPRLVLNPLRQMGQALYNPPNVRGWVGGRNWINSATLAARRRLVGALFNPLNEDKLNADEIAALNAARARGETKFSVDNAVFADLAKLDPAAAADRLLGNFLAAPVSSAFRDTVRQFLTSGAHDDASRLRQLRRTATVLMESSEYQLC
ncbi:MAG: DUF1800 domain-containing protein [Verrucomicrobia bacterium]|nr:DUF1800 domain-containing protein [Verrucomicrobiota bacterium]